MPWLSFLGNRPELVAHSLGAIIGFGSLLLLLFSPTPSPLSSPPPPLPVSLLPPPPPPPPPPPRPPSVRPLHRSFTSKPPSPKPSTPPPPPVFGLPSLSLGHTGSFTVPLGNTLGIPPTPSTSPPPLGESTVSLGEVDRPPEILYKPQPLYPEDLRAQGIEGSVILRVVISSRGEVVRSQVLSATHPGFVTAASEYVQRMRFRPALKGGVPVAVEIRMPVRFLLR